MFSLKVKRLKFHNNRFFIVWFRVRGAFRKVCPFLFSEKGRLSGIKNNIAFFNFSLDRIVFVR
jgi:lipid-A-disaccharide synthase-like uncharacterized protein